MTIGQAGNANTFGGRLVALGLACATFAAAAVPALAAQFSDSAAMKGMTVLQCTGQGRWARGPMDALETYAIDAASGDILVYDKAGSFSSICQVGPGCDIAIDGGSYGVSRQEGDVSYSLAISRTDGGWAEDQSTAGDKQAFVKKSGVCKSIKNPLPKAPKTKF